ncbi:MAG TPA: PspC domain-containing protein [Roseiflexaceae bacterium]|nr:PspC domain-containing protein [Roseiflexaceae bacterium]
MYTPSQRLMRSRSDKMIAGVAGGIGQYLAVDPVIVRLAFVALFFTGVGALLYPILWVIMPLEGGPGAAPAQAFDEMRQQATRLGAEVREVFVAGGPARRRRFDPMTGAPVDPEAEIPINNVDPAGSAPADAQARRNRTLGLVLVGIGAFILLNMLLGPLFGKMLLPLLLVAAGIIILRRGR